jgi:archaellum biogenesis protein FlaJ (TadC family)
MSDQQLRSVSRQQQLMIGLGVVALFIVVSIVAGMLAPGRDLLLALRNIFASIAILAGLLSLLIYLARRLDCWLPPALQVSKEERDQDWRLLALSLVIIALPVLMILIQHLLFHS